MKNYKLFGWAFVASMMTFSACTNDAEEVLTQESEIKLTSEITASRVTSLDYQSTQIVKGQQVGVTITGAKSEHNNIAWSVGDDGALTNTGDAIYYGDGAATITAYHPFNDDWDENKGYAFSVSTDQSSEENYRNSDLLWATATSSKTETAVPLTFTHKLAKINVTLVPEKSGDKLNGATISIYNTKISTTFNPTTGVVSDATGEPQEIIAGVTAYDVYTASAIVIPQEVSGKFIKITHEGKTYYYTLASSKELEAGHSYSYTLTVKDKQLINTGSSINPWNPDSEEGVEGDAEEEDEIVGIPNNQIWYTSSYGKVTPYATDVFGANIVTNVYENGKGVITFDNHVTSIGDKAFYGYNTSSAYLTSITIPNSVTTIGNEAFQECRELNSVTLSNNVTSIGDRAFETCKLTSITIPNSLTTLGEGTFYNCWNLKEFKGKFATEDGYCLIIDNKFYLFAADCGVTEYTVPNNITSIEYGAFAVCHSLTNVTIPNSVTIIGNDAFRECVNLQTITIPNNVTTIGEAAFYYCDKLNSVSIGNSVTSIGSSAFYGCVSLTNINIPNGVTSIESSAFAACSNLASVTISKNINSIGYWAFSDCSNLTNVYCKATIPPAFVKTWNGYWDAFKNNASNRQIYVPNESLNAYKSIEGWEYYADNIVPETSN